MTIAGLLLGLLNIGIVVAILLLVGLLVAWIIERLVGPLPVEARKVYLIIVALIALYLLVALLLGLPTWHPLPLR